MLLPLHILIAVTSAGCSAFIFFKPSRKGLQLSCTLIAGTLATGTILLIQSPAHMVETCTTGLLFVGSTSVLTLFARNKLSTQKTYKD